MIDVLEADKQKKGTQSCSFFGAGEERFELPSMVLETTILPLNYSP